MPGARPSGVHTAADRALAQRSCSPQRNPDLNFFVSSNSGQFSASEVCIWRSQTRTSHSLHFGNSAVLCAPAT